MIIYGSGKSGRIYRNTQPVPEPCDPSDFRRCRLCNEVKPLNEFLLRDGKRTNTCKACNRARRNEQEKAKVEKRERESKRIVVVIDRSDGTEHEFPDCASAAEFIGCTAAMVSTRCRIDGKPIKNRWLVEYVDARP